MMTRRFLRFLHWLMAAGLTLSILAAGLRAEDNNALWSLKPIRKIDPPRPRTGGWARNPIDAFVLARLESAGLTPAPPATKTALLRRAHYDLLGLPPSPQQVERFLEDDSEGAFATVIEKLLQSPHYGEKWARHWLDLVRYAETNSYERDGAKPHVWRYRDYVIESFNQDKPYDRFVVEQLAGDELAELTRDSIVATGFYRLGIWDDEPADPELAHYDDLDDILTTISQGMLGLTINCARCHDHKLDPIPQRDYYRLLAFLNGLNRYGVRSQSTVEQFSVRPIASEAEQRDQQEAVQRHQKEVQETNRQIRDLERLVRKDFEPVEKQEFKHEMNRIPIVKKRVGKLITQEQFDQYVTLSKKQKQLKRFRPPALDSALCVTEVGPKPRDTFLLTRGNPHAKAGLLSPGYPTIFKDADPLIPPPADGAQTSGRRIVLAKWMTSRSNPLTARVIVNRVWQHHFGRGIVRTPNDFGSHGSEPTHPELLDWLANWFMDNGWKLKPLHRLIMQSRTYQMASSPSKDALAKDPTNELFWRYDMRRLTAEEIRDSILSVNGSLNPAMGGPSIYPLIPKEVLAGQSRPGAGWGNSSAEQRDRRSIYIHIKRSLITPLMASFDVADADFTCPVRFSTTQPTQALGMLNSDFFQREAAQFAAYLKKAAGDDPSRQVQLALQRVLQRPIRAKEITRGLDFVELWQTKHQKTRDEALASFCLLALNLNEFIYLD